MSKELTVEEVRKKPEELIAALEDGETVTITRNGGTFATANPAPRSGYRGKSYPFRDLKITPLSKPLGVDPVRELIEERDRERSGKKYGL